MPSVVLLEHYEPAKSTVAGQLLCELGVVDRRVAERSEPDGTQAKQKSCKFAWVSCW